MNTTSNCDCGCCEGTEILTPMTTANRPRLPALSYRVGTHATFLETMLARLSSFCLGPEAECKNGQGRYPLSDLKTRDPGDLAIALLDSWATVADVLTFYQERIANEGYLRTATERRSILEMARLIGYTLRPGVASTAYLAYTIDEDRCKTPPARVKTKIPAGSRAQSVPDSGELPQAFETSEELEARSEWNDLQVRLTQPQKKDSIMNLSENDPEKSGPRIYLKGIGTNLKPNDPLLIRFDSTKTPQQNPGELFRVIEVKPDAVADRTLVTLKEWKVSGTADSLKSTVIKAAGSHLDDAPSSGVVSSKLAQLVKDTKTTLGELTDNPEHRKTISALVAYVEEEVIPKVSVALQVAIADPEELKLAVPWLQSIIVDLNDAILRVSTPTLGSNITRSPTADQIIKFDELLKPLLKPASLPPANSARLDRTLSKSFTEKADTGLRLLTSFQPALTDTLTNALARAKVTKSSPIKAYALRLKASLHGNNLPREPQYEPVDGARNSKAGQLRPQATWPEWTPALDENGRSLFLDADYPQLLPGGFVALLTPDSSTPLIYGNIGVRSLSRNAYGFGAKTTLITLPTTARKPWWTPDSRKPETFNFIRRTTVYAQSEELPLAEEPIPDDVCGGRKVPIDLDDVYSGLEPGRWLIVSGERTDVKNTDVKNNDGVVVPGLKASELVMLAGSENVFNKDLPDDTNHTRIQLAEDLAYCYKRDTVVIYGNVVKATHGETRKEVLGGGDGSKMFQQFTLKQPPLTHVPSPTPAGVESTLAVRVNDVEWHETDSLADLARTDRNFITLTDDDGKTTVIFGNGKQGARLPTGQENIRAVYRNGIGKPGNVKGEQISLLMSRPLGVKDVINPLRASGGADKESRDQARRNAPLAVTALDRLVSTQDYADFARTFAGIGKASATRLSDGRRQLVHVTIAGADDIPIDESSDVFKNLRLALHQFGDPFQPVQLAARKLKLLVIQANVRVKPDYLWENDLVHHVGGRDVKPKVTAALLDYFSFDRRDLGQEVSPSEAISVIQAVEGVAYVDLDKFDALDEKQVRDTLVEKTSPADQKISLADQIHAPDRILVELAQLNPRETDPSKRITPAALAYLSPDVPSTILLNEAL